MGIIGSETIPATVIATVIAAGIITFISFCWKYRELMQEKILSFFQGIRNKDVVSLREYVAEFREWKSDNAEGIVLHITEGESTLKHTNIVAIKLLKNHTKEHHILMIQHGQGHPILYRSALVDSSEVEKIAKTLHALKKL